MRAELWRFIVVPLLRRGYRPKEMAHELGVSVSTIRRDLTALLAQGTIAVVRSSYNAGARRGGAFPWPHRGPPRKRPL
jgi:predicted ArsR family transcriptional regulator